MYIYIYKLKNITTSGFVPHAVSEHAHISVVLPKEGAAGLQTQIISLFFHLKLVCELKTRFLKDSQLINQFVSKINGLDFFLFNFFFQTLHRVFKWYSIYTYTSVYLSKKLRATGQCSCAFQYWIAFWMWMCLRNHLKSILNWRVEDCLNFCSVSPFHPKLVWKIKCVGAARCVAYWQSNIKHEEQQYLPEQEAVQNKSYQLYYWTH